MKKSDHSSWHDFDKLHVVRRLRELVGNWWNIQLNFTDKKGFVRGVPQGRFFNPINDLCRRITADEKGFKGCMATVRQTTVEAQNAKKPRLAQCHSGFSTLSIPLRIADEYLGCVFGDGFIISETEAQQKVQIADFFRKNFRTEPELLEHIDKLPVLTKKDVFYLTELIQMVVDEITSTHSDLSNARTEVTQLKNELGERYSFDQMIGKSPAMQSLYLLLERICDSEAMVLIQGENGTGKELIARALHYNSKRKKNKFVVANCGAFNDNLLESELFGHVKGAFTGAIKDKIGLFESANGGTLFLDEIGDTTPQMQVKLLRILQQHTFTPVGATEMKKTTARVVCATNRDLSAMVKKGEFREDLFYRLNVINVVVPPLRDRKEDIPLLIEHFLKKYASSTKSQIKTPAQECMEQLLSYSWPGNIRELENEIERLAVLSGSELSLKQDMMSPRIKDYIGTRQTGYRIDGKLKDAIEELERNMIFEGLKRTRWNKSKLAKELGISRAGLIMKVEKYDLDKRNIS